MGTNGRRGTARRRVETVGSEDETKGERMQMARLAVGCVGVVVGCLGRRKESGLALGVGCA